MTDLDTNKANDKNNAAANTTRIDDAIIIQQNLVKRFYEIIWNQHEHSIIPDVLHTDFTFRGSLGDEKQGHVEFIEYLDKIHAALDNYQCSLLDMVSEPEKVFAKMRFSGIHTGLLMGYKATGQKVNWDAAALFNFRDDKIIDLWVLGDLIALENQLKN